MKCSDTYTESELTAGVVLHNEAHNRQALLLGPSIYGVTGENRRLALVFDTHTGKRDLSNESEVIVASSLPNTQRWHIAEHYELGMEVEAIPPDVRPCLWKRDELALRQVCPCGCGRAGLPCRCDYCDGDCEGGVRYPGAACSSCQSHGECGCNCGCSDTTDDQFCNYCNDHSLCDGCIATHDIYEGNLCGDCYQEQLDAEAKEAREEEEREQERLAGAGAS
jgi:hypothetical protein